MGADYWLLMLANDVQDGSFIKQQALGFGIPLIREIHALTSN